MSTNMSIKFETPDLPETGTIEILSWSHGFTQPTGPRTAGQATHQNLSFTKYLDGNSTLLMRQMWSGKQFGRATLSCYRSSGVRDDKPSLYLTVEMEHVIIANLSVSGGPGDIPVENVALEYGIVQYHYIDQKHDDGSPLPTAHAPFRATNPAVKE
jgi:type VI secretion system Hcp family effector